MITRRPGALNVLARRIALIGTIIVVASCARGSQLARDDTRTPVELTVENKSSEDLTVYVVHDGRTERLDRVEAARKKVLVIPTRMIGSLGDLRLIGERPGARAGYPGRISTQIVTPARCQRLEWKIEAILDQSSLGVFPSETCS